jgi:hypothetical protein
VDLLAEHRAHYAPPDREPDMIRIDTTAGAAGAVEKAVDDLCR